MRHFLHRALTFLRANWRIWAGFRRREPWITRFLIDGKPYGGWYYPVGDPRLRQFYKAFPGCEAILELGSLEGGHSFELASTPGVQRVVALEGREYNLEKSRYVQGLLGIENVEFVHSNFETDGFDHLGKFDAVLSLGVLYHLSRPWEHLVKLHMACPRLFLWTHYTLAPQASLQGGYPGIDVQEYGFEDPLSGLMRSSFWPTLSGLEAMLKDAGYQDVRIINNDPKHQDGPCITLTAC